MAFVKGERFQVDLDTEDGRETGQIRQRTTPNAAFDFHGDIKERTLSAPKSPTAPSLKETASGFPAHKKRVRVSAFKQQRNQKHTLPDYKNATHEAQASVQTTGAAGTDSSKSWEENERERIDQGKPADAG